MKIAVIRRDWWLGIMLLLFLVALFALEFYGKIFERGIGNYLKWQNSTRSQLGRVWDQDRQTVLAQAKVKTIRSLLDSRQESAQGIDSLKALFEEVGFEKDRICSVAVFLPLLNELDPKTQQAVFPDPRWFLAKDYSITRIGVREFGSLKKIVPRLEFGIEYNTDYNSGVLLIPVSQDIANNVLSQIERTNIDIWGEAFSSLAVPSIGDNP